MKRVLIPAIMLLILLGQSLAEAQVPTPPNVPTLGPVIICSDGDNIKIFSPQNQSYSNSQINLDFSVEAAGMFGQFGNVGYNLDNGIIHSVNSFVNKSVDHPADAPDWYYNRTIVFASVTLPQLSDGPHNATVYYGWQYLGTNNPSLERFEVFAFESVNFAVGKATDTNTQSSPSQSTTPTVPEFPPTILLIIFISIATLLGTVEIKRKQFRRRIL